ncbi:uncharacterized protein JN550_001438 [Neoarthrinium moseri]|uniref:uncharacterized protein n=1 Tax=Neoarthrinium moseri TaxID=1658444 RepID=UPI001FDCB6A5|nr:uncharacterized protein JN550_001438 [Neoarthrinium moseri]KAI1875942.1 hypothetical protein JN550_001438 [Neoarthrinium moseri]
MAIDFHAGGIEEACNRFLALPPEVHLLCPKVSEDDEEDYEDLSDPGEIGVAEKLQRLQDFRDRVGVVYQSSLIFGFEEGTAGDLQKTFSLRVGSLLQSCSHCARTWHRNRRPFLKTLAEIHDDATVVEMSQRLDRFDADRITAGLEGARKFINDHNGVVEQRTFIEEDRSDLLVALYEALCCMPYLKHPENRVHFDYVFAAVQQKRALKLAEVLPTMTRFLFDDDKVRLAFAKVSWQKMPKISVDDFEWAVKESLEGVLQRATIHELPESLLKSLWEGVAMILNALEPENVDSALGSLNPQPSIYQLMLNHMSTESDASLAAVLKVFNMTLQKGPKGFWSYFASYSPASVAEAVLASRAYKPLLARTREYSISMPEDKYLKGPVAVAWVKPFIESINTTQKSHACDSILHHFLDEIAADTSLPMEGRLACYRAAAESLLTTMNTFLDSSYNLSADQPAIFTNRILNLVVKHKDVLIFMAKLGRHNATMSRMAMSVIGAALTLDCRLTAAEYKAYVDQKPVQQEIIKDSPSLWDAFLELLKPGETEFAETMMLAITPLIAVESLRPTKKEHLSQVKEDFNARLGKVADSISKMIESLKSFDSSDLERLLDSPVMKAVVAAMIHGERALNRAGQGFIEFITLEAGRSDAVSALLKSHFSTLLTSVTAVLDEGKDSGLWSPQQPILRYSKDLLDGLCDPFDGVLRTRDLTEAERSTLKKWWEIQWAIIDTAFAQLDGWSKTVDTGTMKEFCRDTMDLADAFLAQDGLISSALGSLSISENLDAADDSKDTAMKAILEPPRDKCKGMTQMLRLKDRYLVQKTVAVLGKLLRRLVEFDVEVPPAVLKYIKDTCIKKPTGKYEIATNLNDQERAELLRAVGEDEDEIQIVDIKKAVAPKKQSSLDAWSKSGDGSSRSQSPAVKTPRDDVRDLASTLDKNRSIIDQMRARQSASTKSTVKPTLSKPASKPAPARLDAASLAKLKADRIKEQEAKKKRDAEAIARAKALRAPKPLVSGEGSGLQGLTGVLGKDHAPRGEMMVDSSSEDEGDSDDDAAFLEQTQAGKKRIEDASRRVMQLKAPRGPVKKTKIQRSANDMRARLTPNMNVLHQAILDWDIFHEGNDPPNLGKSSRVSTSYGDPRQYKETFLPLLIYEAWRGFVTDKDETTSKPFVIKIANRMNVDKFIDVTTTMPLKTDSRDEFLSEGDIVLLSVSPQPLQSPQELHCLGRVSRAQVKFGAREVSYRLSGRAGAIIQLLNPKAEIFAVKITNMRTIEREFAALESLQYYDLMQEVLEAKPSPMLSFGADAVNKVMANYRLNAGQAKAILNARENDAFTLIQGPPGTGKTKTIVAMVGALLTGNLTSTTGTVIQKPGPASNGQPTSKKLLVCAPSNAAVDELVLRLKEGVKTMTGSFHKINVLRLGRSDAINAAVKDVTLDELVRQRIDGDAAQNTGPSDRQKMHEEAGQIKQELYELRPMLDAAKIAGDKQREDTLGRQFEELRRRQKAVGARIDADKDKGNSVQRESEIRRRQVQQQILDSAHVLCSTLSGAGHEMLKGLSVEFETVIIDEAAQCVELSALIPLKYGCSKCILVGDPKQLPPTVLSQSAQRYGYDQSLFVRMQQNSPKDIHLLDEQYRMHPEISRFPSQEFYEGKLADGADMAKLRHQPWHQTGLLGPYRFFDVKGSQERGRKGQSLINYEELKVALQLYQRFKFDNPRLDLKGKIGIITPYKAQLYQLREQFAAKFGPSISEEIEFNTTDAFQGRECEIIIFSCVRASPTGGIGFMTDIRRMNVGLTRAKSSLWILGDSRALVQGEFWNKLIEDAKARALYTTGNILAQLTQPGAKLPPPDFSNMSSPRTPASEPDLMEVDEVDMRDAPAKPTSFSKKATQLPETYTIIERPGPPAGAMPSAYAGINERGEPVTGPTTSPDRPIIHSSGSKRPRDDSGDGGQPAKRKSSGFLPGKTAPSRPKAMPRPTDPSAMSVLGIPGQSNGSKPPPSHPANAPKGPRASRPNPMIPPKKKPANPFITKKPNPPR